MRACGRHKTVQGERVCLSVCLCVLSVYAWYFNITFVDCNIKCLATIISNFYA